MILENNILVTTHALAVKKAVHMVQKMELPILGIVENMSYYPCPDTGKLHNIFGPSHVDEIASLANVALSARLPITPEIAIACDAGELHTVHMPAIDQITTYLTL